MFCEVKTKAGMYLTLRKEQGNTLTDFHTRPRARMSARARGIPTCRRSIRSFMYFK